MRKDHPHLQRMQVKQLLLISIQQYPQETFKCCGLRAGQHYMSATAPPITLQWGGCSHQTLFSFEMQSLSLLMCSYPPFLE
jgi:hypothetical protein